MAALSRWFCRVVVAVAQLALVAAAGAQSPAAGAWTKTPALPTACYQSEDQFWTTLEAAQAAVAADHQKQQEINRKVKEDFQRIDMSELARRMQAKMMQDPQNAAKYLQAMQSLAQDAIAEVSEDGAKEAQMQAEADALAARYEEALAKAQVPGTARWDALKKKMGIAADSTSPGESGVPDWAWKEWDGILREWDKGYQANCGQWWAASGQAHAFMKRYRDYLVQERIPNRQQYDQATVASYQMLGISSASYTSTAEFEAAESYLRLAGRVFGLRRDKPRCSAQKCE